MPQLRGNEPILGLNISELMRKREERREERRKR
jgi:hypothetical protein